MCLIEFMVKKKKNHIDWVFGVTAVLICFVLYFPLTFDVDNDDSTNSSSDEFWEAQIIDFRGQNQTVKFHYMPADVEDVTIPANFSSAFERVVSNEADVGIGIGDNAMDKAQAGLAGVEIAKVSGRLLGLNTSSGTLENDTGFRHFSCEIASQDLFVFELRNANVTELVSYDNCLSIRYAEGESVELLRQATAVVFSLLDLR